MDEAPVFGGLCSPEDELVPDLFGAEGPFASENMVLQAPAAVQREGDQFHVFKDAYLSAADPKEPLLRALTSPPPGADCQAKVKVELEDERDDQEGLAEYPGLPELSPMEDALLARAPPPAYNVHFLSSLLAPRRSPAVVPLGAWPREGAAHPGVRVIPVEIKEAGGTITGNNPEEATFPNPHAQESCCKFPASHEPEGPSDCSHKDSNPMVICQLKGGTQMLCIDHSGARELKALHLLPQYQDQSSYPQSDVPKPMTTLVGRFLPVPAKLNLITQQLENGALSPVVNSSALPGPPKLTLAGYCDCFASGDFCNNCNCHNCCNNLRHEIERFKAIKACLDRNPEAFQPKIGTGNLGDVKPRHNKGCNCRRSGCLKNYCECYEAKIMCSSICKCIGCKNYDESPERKTLMSLPNAMEIGRLDDSHFSSPAKFSALPKSRKDRRSFTCISWEVVEATCACLLAQGEEAEKERCPECLAEQRILEEFGRCLSQILHIEFKSRGLKME
ncbi:tesmin [Elephas maximus indicus]|uniref:tesmin n=1 Tax=Elephas maximus indicus TaxID=99487 RepID=UPI0021160343|nr:tesmin [Elephas maximus indicus]